VHLSFLPPSSPVRSDLVKECRGLVLQIPLQQQQQQQWKVVAAPLRKFYSFDEDLYSEEKFVPNIYHPNDITNNNEEGEGGFVTIYEKPAGVSVCLFYYHEHWLLSPFIGNSLYAQQRYWTFTQQQHHQPQKHFQKWVESVFWSLWEQNQCKLPATTTTTTPNNNTTESENSCYMFVLHERNETLCFVGCRNLQTLEEEPEQNVTEIAEKHHWSMPKQFTDDVTTLKKKTPLPQPLLITTCSAQEQLCQVLQVQSRELSVFTHEGYVLVSREKRNNSSTSRLKVCSESVALLNEINSCEFLSSMTQKNLEKNFLFLVRKTFHQRSEFIHTFPQWQEWYDFVWKKVNAFCEAADALYEELKHIKSAKDFADKIPKSNKISKVFFVLRKEKFQYASEYITSQKYIEDRSGVHWLEVVIFHPL